MHEINLIMPTFDEIIMQTYNDMIKQGLDATGGLLLNKTARGFLGRQERDQDLVMAEWDNLFSTSVPGPDSMGFQPPAKGTLVELTVAEFEAIDHPPSGLTYKVNCNPNGNGINTFLDMRPTAGGEEVRDIVVLTNCSVDFNDNSDWRGVMVVSTRERSNATLRASAAARVGDPDKSCSKTDQSYIYARSDMQVAAEFSASNVVFMSASDVSIASGTSGEVDHYGMTVFADGNVRLTTNHNYYVCGYPADLDIIGIPTFKYIKQVMPENESARL